MGHVPNQAVLFAMMIGIVAAMGCAAWKAPVEGQEIRRKSGRVVRRAGAARPRRRLTHAKPTRPRTGATSWPIFFPLQVTHATRKFCPRPEHHLGKRPALRSRESRISRPVALRDRVTRPEPLKNHRPRRGRNYSARHPRRRRSFFLTEATRVPTGAHRRGGPGVSMCSGRTPAPFPGTFSLSLLARVDDSIFERWSGPPVVPQEIGNVISSVEP
jgi:hypothetical protein